MRADAGVRARIPQEMKDRARAAPDNTGLTTSDLIRLVMCQSDLSSMKHAICRSVRSQ